MISDLRVPAQNRIAEGPRSFRVRPRQQDNLAGNYSRPQTDAKAKRRNNMSAKNLIYETLKLVGKNRGVGKLTTRKLVGNLRTIAKYMATQGLQSIHHMRTKHVMNFFRLQID